MATVIDTLQVKFEAIGDQFETSINRTFGRGGLFMRLTAGAAAAGAAAIAGFTGKAIFDLVGFEHSMAKVFRNIGDTSTEMETELTDGVRAIAVEYGISADKVAQALSEYAYAGLSVEDALDSLETATRGAIAADADLAETLTKLDGIWAAFKGQGYEVVEVMDVLTSLTSNANGGFDALTSAMVGASAQAVNAGVSIEELGAAIGGLTWLGVPAAEASTQIRHALKELADSSTNVGERFSDLTGRSFKQFMAEGGTLREAIDILTAGLVAGEDISQLFGSSLAGNAISMIAAGEGADYYDQVLGSLIESAGSTDTAFERMSGTLKSKTDLLLAQFKELTLSLGDKLAPALHGVVDAAIDGFPKFQAVVEQVFDAIGDGINWVIGAWHAYQTDTEGVWATIRGVIESVGAAIALVFDYLASLWESVLKPAWDALPGAISEQWDGVQGVFAAARDASESFFKFLAALWERVLKPAWELIRPGLELIWEAIKITLAAAWEAIKIIWETALNIISGIFDAFTAALEGDWEGVWEALQRITQAAWDGISALVKVAADALLAFLGGSWEQIKSNAAAVWTSIRDLAGNMWAGVVNAITGAFNGLAGFFAGLWQGIVDGIKGAVNAGIDFINRLINAWNSIEMKFGGGTLFGGQTISLPGGIEFGIPAITMPAVSFGVPKLPTIPALAAGGIVDSATLALIGEAGPEAVIPLDRLGEFGGDTTIIIELDGRTLARAVAPRLVGEARLKTGLVGV